MNPHRYEYKVLILLVLLTFFTGIECGAQGPLAKRQVTEPVLQELKSQFFLSETVELALMKADRKISKEYFEKRKDNFVFMGSERRDQMTVDGYTVAGRSSVIGLSLFFFDGSYLTMVNVMINPLEEEKAKELIKKSLDSVDASGEYPIKKAKLYFLGVYKIEPTRIIKIMIREDVLVSGSVIYSINYAISGGK